MSQMSNYLENALFNAVLRNTSYTPPTTVYVALHTADPTETGATGEVSGGSYARQAITFEAPTDGMGGNNTVVTFPVATGNWGTISHVSIKDSLNSGNTLFFGALTISKIIETNDQFIISTGNLVVSLQ